MKLSIAFSLAVVGVAYAQGAAESASASVDAVSSAAPSASAADASSVAPASRTASGRVRTGTRGAASASSTPSAGASSAIPTGISDSCTTYLRALNRDKEFASCTAPLIAATSAFIPGAANKNADALASTLNTLCAAAGCTDSFIRKQLVDFYASCKTELTGSGGNKAVKDTYDILYIMVPLKKSLCSKDNGTYCVLKTPSQATDAAVKDAHEANPLGVANNFVEASDTDKIHAAVAAFEAVGNITPVGTSLSRRAPGDQGVVQYKPDTKVYRENGVMYLFTMPSLSKDALCTECTQQVLKAYVPWEAAVPYGPGLSNSPMLGGQAELWRQIKAKCEAGFLAKVQQAIGTAKGTAANAGVAATQLGVWGAALGAAVSIVFAL